MFNSKIYVLCKSLSRCFPVATRVQTNKNAFQQVLRSYSNKQNDRSYRNRSTVYYITGVGVLAVGLSYAAVPLYRLFCQVWALFWCFNILFGKITSINKCMEDLYSHSVCLLYFLIHATFWLVHLQECYPKSDFHNFQECLRPQYWLPSLFISVWK